MSPGSRVGRRWIALLFLAAVALGDWRMYRSAVGVVLVVVVGSAFILYPEEIFDRLRLRPLIDGVPQSWRPLILAVPPLLYYAIRVQGPDGIGPMVLVVSLGMMAVVVLFGPQIDEKLAGFYESRDRAFPPQLRLLAAFVLPVGLGLLLAQGAIAANRVLLANVLSGVVVFLLVRQATAGDEVVIPAGARAALDLGWRATHVAGAGGVRAWSVPDPASVPIADLAQGVELVVAERRGDWARAVASNGWEGWVDARLLVERKERHV